MPPAPGTAATPPPAAGGPMKTPTGSAMAEDLKKIGIDPLHPPPLAKLSPDVIRKLMPTFAKSLGVKCEACHDVNNFKASTPHKKVAAQMWQHFVVELSLESGEPLYCDSCHGGKQEFLDTHDKKALSGWMDANYVSKLKRADKKDHSLRDVPRRSVRPEVRARLGSRQVEERDRDVANGPLRFFGPLALVHSPQISPPFPRS